LFNGRQIPIIVNFKNIEDLQRRIAPHSYRVLKEDCLDLPPKLYAFRDVDLTATQFGLYEQMKAFATAHLGNNEYVSATIAIAQIARLHQIACGWTRDEVGKLHVIPSNRTKVLLEVLEEAGPKAIIWASYRENLSEIVATLRGRFGDASTVAFWGDTTMTDRQVAIRRFQEDPTCHWFVGNQASGGLGITLTAAKTVVYFSNTFSLVQRVQSEDRAHRAGLRHPVTYIDLRARGTVDERIVQALRAGIDIESHVTGDEFRKWLI
jgi:SNF2 family DNA or RNA helicase